jgi:type I restriction enzyme, S subunit
MTFKEVQLQDILDIQWGDTKTTKASYVSDGYLAYSATGPDGFLEKFDYDREGIVLSAIGANCGSTFFATGKWSCIKNTIRMLPKSDAIDLKYFFYMTKAPDFWPIRGSAQPFISQTDIRELYVQIPELAVQKAIGEILFTLEEKIATNNALSKTLEQIARTLFKSWFIDFDPVKAKIAGENPVGMDSATAALFPDSMVDSELGLIPKGWIVSILESISSVKYGAPFASKLFNTTKVGQPLIRIRDLKKQSISTWSPEHHPKGFLVTSGELLVGMDGEFNPTIWFGQDALVNQRICKIEPKDFVSNFFLYFTLVPIMRKIEHGSTGSTVIHLGKTDIDAIKIVVPSRELLSAFKSSVEPLLKQMVSLNVQARVLQEARDALLPRLISGELQIPKEMLAS